MYIHASSIDKHLQRFDTAKKKKKKKKEHFATRAIMEHEFCIKKLYKASMSGCVGTLSKLLQEDPIILDRISLTSFTETPLHISSLLGHIDFTKALLHHKPKLAAELDSQGQSPLHLASAEGYAEIVEALLSINTDVCLVLDQYGRIPLHLAAIRGRVEVMKQLINACPASIKIKSPAEQTVLHLCVKHNRLDALKVLLTYANVSSELINAMDNDGHTILHLATLMKQVKTIKYLVSLPEMRVEVDAFLTIAKNLSDVNIMTVQDHIITEPTGINQLTNQHSATRQHQAGVGSNNDLIKYLDYQSNWMEKTRGNLMVVATVIASMAFQAAINPPGGVWQEDNSNACPKGKQCKVGTSVLVYTNELQYHAYIASNTISFTASLAIIFLLMCGFPLKNRVSMFILLLAMCTTMVFIVSTYIISMNLVGKEDDSTITRIDIIYAWFWVGLIAIVVAFHVIKLTIWVLKKLFIGVFLAARYSFGILYKLLVFKASTGSVVEQRAESAV